MINTYCLLAILGGALLPLQAGINGNLRTWLGNPWCTTLVSFAVSSCAVLLMSIITKAQVPNSAVLAQIPWWAWTGGIMGGIYVCSALVSAPKLGAMALVSSLIAGQMIASMLLDQFGVAGYSQHSLNAGRTVGAILLCAGVFLIQKY
ncbi:MAG TPA: DMT family transporter [Candidatus Obscuribacterales bacterium]